MGACLESLHGGSQIAEAASSSRIPNVAGASPLCDMPAHTLNRKGVSTHLDLLLNRGFILAEAIAQRPRARRLLLPDSNPNIGGAKNTAAI